MKAAYVGLWLSLMGGVALAQTSPNATTPPSAPSSQGSPAASDAQQGGGTGNAGSTSPQGSPAAPDAQQGGGPGNAGGMSAQASHPNGSSGPDQQYQGEIIQTPNGDYFVAEPQDNEGPPPQEAEGMPPQGPESMGPRPHPGHRPPPPSKAAHFRIKGPDLALDIKCPDEEPVKACVDAASVLIDKASTAHH